MSEQSTRIQIANHKQLPLPKTSPDAGANLRPPLLDSRLAESPLLTHPARDACAAVLFVEFTAAGKPLAQLGHALCGADGKRLRGQRDRARRASHWDGDEDLFTADWNAGRLVWYENQDGRFVRFDFAVEVDHPAAIATADLDNDGDLDVIATSGCVPRTTEIADNVSFVDGDDTISLQIRNAHWQPQGLQCRSLPW